MPGNTNILLTGATGLVGRSVLRELLLRGQSVTAIVRPRSGVSGEERLRNMMRQNGWPDDWQALVQVINGFLPDGLPTEKGSLEACDRVIHCAAALNFDRNRSGEPWRTNVEGTIQLGQLAAECGIQKFLYVSTAYVCGLTSTPVMEQVENSAIPRNDYEASKQAAENWLVHESGLDWTIARPGIVVGDSRTGYTTNYFGIYRVLKSIARLCERLPVDSDGMKCLPMRLQFSGNETTNLIPVDYVATAIAELALRDDVVGECVHLTPEQPLRTSTLLDAISSFHQVQGIQFVGEDGTDGSERNVFERIFDRETEIVGQYFQDDPQFDITNRKRLLPQFPSTPVDHSMLMRLQAFADADRWGAVDRASDNDETFDCGDFFLRHFPAASAASNLAQIEGLSTVVQFEIRGTTRGFWLCRLEAGRVVDIAPTGNRASGADFVYQTDSETFQQIIAGHLNVRQAFFDRRINIHGDIERALLLSILFEDLLQESPYQVPDTLENLTGESACA